MVQVGQPKELQKSNTRGRILAILTYRPATTQPQLPPPQTMMSNSSGRVLNGGFMIYSPMFAECSIIPDYRIPFHQSLTLEKGDERKKSLDKGRQLGRHNICSCP